MAQQIFRNDCTSAFIPTVDKEEKCTSNLDSPEITPITSSINDDYEIFPFSKTASELKHPNQSAKLHNEKEHLMSCMSCGNLLDISNFSPKYGSEKIQRDTCAFCTHLDAIFKGPSCTDYNYCSFGGKEVGTDNTNTLLCPNSELPEQSSAEYESGELMSGTNVVSNVEEYDTLACPVQSEIAFQSEHDVEIFNSHDGSHQHQPDMFDYYYMSFRDEFAKTKSNNAYKSVHNLNSDEQVKYCSECSIQKYAAIPVLDLFPGPDHDIDFT